MKDVYLILSGRQNYFLQLQYYFRHHAAILSEVTNATMGGKGAFKWALSNWKLPDDPESRPMTNEERKAIIDRYNQKRKK